MRIGGWEILVILAVILLLFGPRRLPEIGRAFGRTIQEFRRATKDREDEASEEGDDKETRGGKS
jgi:sec-independent protein translocase protein TatA